VSLNPVLAYASLRKAALITLAGLQLLLQSGGAMAQPTTDLRLSRGSGVNVVSVSGNSSGSAFFVDDELLLTCFHVVAALSAQGQTINWRIHPDLEVIMPSVTCH
jgi:hypothetical protein